MTLFADLPLVVHCKMQYVSLIMYYAIAMIKKQTSESRRDSLSVTPHGSVGDSLTPQNLVEIPFQLARKPCVLGEKNVIPTQ